MKIDPKRIANPSETFALIEARGWNPATDAFDYFLPERVKEEVKAAWNNHFESLDKQLASEMVIEGEFTVKEDERPILTPPQ